MGRFRELMKERDAKLGIGMMAASPLIAAIMPTHGISPLQELGEIITPMGIFIAGTRLWGRATDKFSFGAYSHREDCAACGLDGYVKRALYRGARYFIGALMRKED
ncbi:MAG: hypothetical protein KGH59_04305 [Candidatus Micrarchaeota archaeon]|nr:hypothetical protein [Candidatus Micrarchaeota archaeon]